MKTNWQMTNIKKRTWLAWSVLAMVLSLNIACNKSNNNDNPPAAPYLGQYGNGIMGNCMNCNFAQAPLGTAQSQGTNSFPISINWQLIGDQNLINQSAVYGSSYGMSPQKTYNGPLALTGAMTLSQSVPAGNCIIPAGQYQINSIQAGTMSQGVINIPQLEAIVGGARIIFTLQSAVVIDANGDGQIERIAGLLMPMQGPGYNMGAGYPYTNQYPGAGLNYAGVMASCNDVGVYLQ